MNKFFLSHSSQDDDFVRALRSALADHSADGWIDSRELGGGAPIWTDIQEAIEDASAYAVVVSPASLQSKWVGRELRYALEVQKEHGRAAYPVIPLSLDGTKLGVLEEFFGEEPLYIAVSSSAGGVEAALHAILVALGKRLPTDLPSTPQPKAELLEELVLELSDFEFVEQAGKRRARARARLRYEPATPGQREVVSTQSWRITAPLGPIEIEELRWYLEKYAIWPSRYFGERAAKVEANLLQWGQLLYQEAFRGEATANVLQAWARIASHAGRRFSVYINATLDADATEEEQSSAKAAATQLLSLPWELLHDGESYLFQGAKPTRVRRRLPNTRVLDLPLVETPIRVLLISARPEDDACVYIDHRASALPLVSAMEALPGLVKLHLLSPPTLPALRAELERARDARQPYHVVHFDGHGVYDPQVGLGGLCFEHPDDSHKLGARRHFIAYTDELGPLLRDQRIPLVFLEACQSAQAESASESVASELLKVGVASVVAMSHSVLVETARRFVEAFYDALAAGKRVGDAMLAGQRQLKDDSLRGQVFGVGELRLQDWFVPVLFQEKEDPQLFTLAPSRQSQEDFQRARATRLGAVPPEPATGFVGRSRELLALQRLLLPLPLTPSPSPQKGEGGRYAVLRGQGGEGKTALAAEFARWVVRSQQMRRAAFVSVETHSHTAALLDALGQQLVGKEYSVATYKTLEEAMLPVERALREEATLLLVDNMESILLPPYLAAQTPAALADEAHNELQQILTLCQRLQGIGDTRLIFTSRETLPAPFAAARNCIELQQLDPEDALKLVERVLHAAGDTQASSDASREEIEQLVADVHGHARTLALLAPALGSRGVAATHRSLVALMAEMEHRFPGSREQSFYASVELSLRRLAPANQERVGALGVFHGAVDLDALRHMMEWDAATVDKLANELLTTGLATPNRYNHLTLNPALCPYLHAKLTADERTNLRQRWADAMRAYVKFLEQQSDQNAEMAATLTLLELPNLFALLDQVQATGDGEATIGLTTSLYQLLQGLGKPRLLARVGQVRDAAAARLGTVWNQARFEATRTRIEQQLASGELQSAFTGAQQLLQQAQAAGEAAYPGADYDLAMAHILLARVLQTGRAAQQALPLLAEARQRFEAVAQARDSQAAARMASACFSEQGACLLDLGRLDEAAAAYEENIRRAEQRGDERDVAVGKGQLGTVRKNQRRYNEALTAYADARQRFNQLGEPGTLAVFWHQTGMVYEEMGKPAAAEDAYRQSLALEVRLGNVAGQADTLGQLGLLYDNVFDRTEEAITFLRQAQEIYVEIKDVAGEGRQANNIAIRLRKLHRLDEARQEIRRAIECMAQFGHAAEPWKSWNILANIEIDAGNPSAAAAARGNAIASYLAYRRDGGENHDSSGRIALAVTQALLAGEEDIESVLQELIAHPNVSGVMQTFIPTLQAIVAGSRDRSFADAADLHYRMAAEILFLIETLEGLQRI